MKKLMLLTSAVVLLLMTTGWGFVTSETKNEAALDGYSLDIPTASSINGIPQAIDSLKTYSEKTPQKMNMLSNMEYGELLRLNKQYSESNDAYLKADEEVKKWEEKSAINPEKFFSNLAAALFTESAKIYEGQDYEKVWLTTRLAMNKIAMGDFDGARVDIKRTHEREALIANFRSKELQAAEDEAKAKGVDVKNKEINGYPVETINDPEVLKLKNGYQNALSHYLAGFLYESLNEPSLAAPGYRKAIELKPETKILEEGLNGLDTRTSFTHKKKQKMTDVLIVLETGLAPERKSNDFSIMVPSANGTIAQANMSYPVIDPSQTALMQSVELDGSTVVIDDVVDSNIMARRALKDEMPSITLRNTTRMIAKEVAKGALSRTGFGGILDMISNQKGPTAADRMWHMLPERVYIARTYLSPGQHNLNIKETGQRISFQVDGQYAIVPLRIMSDGVAMGTVGSIGKLVN